MTAAAEGSRGAYARLRAEKRVLRFCQTFSCDRHPVRRVAKLVESLLRPMVLMLVAVVACWCAPANATPVNLKPALCHAVTGLERGDGDLSSLRFSCAGEPKNYRQGSLWLNVAIDRLPVDPRDIALMIAQSRFDRLAVAFSYADGAVRWQEVRRGASGAHWRAGGQLLFEAPERDAPVTAVTMRLDRQADYGLVHARLMTRQDAMLQSTGLAVAVGAALTLLLMGGIYTASLAFALRRQFLAWHGGWAACMLLWGTIWSQLHLFLVPAMAGAVSARICTFLSCLAVTLATASVVTSFGPGMLPRPLRIGTLALGVAVALLGIPLTLMGGDGLMALGDVLGVLILADLFAVALCLVLAWRRGAGEARDFVAAWSVPMVTLAVIQLVDMDDSFWGAGSKLLILVAATWQTLWLAGAATRRLRRLRIERDRARASEAQAHELARRDSLTGLRNRRGFVESVGPLLDRARADGLPAALLLVDIDRFKSINDLHGHEAGDVVLSRVGHRIGSWEGAMCTVGRIGGEEFALLTIGLEGAVLGRFAESVRTGIAACDHRDTIGEQAVTASVGVAEAHPAADFRHLFRLADEALYEAKHGGRNRTAWRRETGDIPPVAQAPARARWRIAKRGG